MKRIYFVRHGESEANVSDNHSGPLTPLTPRGHEQAAFIAERCSRLHLDTLITSTYVRAMQTAKYIAEKTGLNPIESDLFVENRFVSASFGKPRSTPELIEAMQKIVDHWGAPGYHAADEENFEEVVARADQALAFLSKQKEERIGVVTHGNFLRNLVGRATFGKQYSPYVSNVFFRAIKVTENTAITVLDFDDTNTQYPWRLWIWNDHAHLG